MLPSGTLTDDGQPLIARQDAPGIYVVDDAYAGHYDFFAKPMPFSIKKEVALKEEILSVVEIVKAVKIPLSGQITLK